MQFRPRVLGQQITAAAPMQTPPPVVPVLPKWAKIGLGMTLVGAGSYGAFKKCDRCVIQLRKSTPELVASAGSIAGGVYILLEAFDIHL